MTGLRFGETMSGRLAPQEPSPIAGYDAPGALAATLRARIDIPDLTLFVDGGLPHRGRLDVELDIPVLGTRRFVAHEGEFELFRAGEVPSGRRGYWMVYDAFLTDGDRVYQMTGRKYLQPGWRLYRVWPDTTVLFVVLRDVTHGGRVDVGGPVDQTLLTADPGPATPAWLAAIDVEEPAALRDYRRPKYLAGKIRITPAGFGAQLLSMRAIGAPWYRRPFTVARFLCFFAGSLVRIYVGG
ncbi:hypothetical protein HZU40_14500 [Mycolicibacterium fluoranthenivorans]|uniref:Uncharacterized protein n=1 Tax=Mycolicibacterium fluoranthenivorans TaxID=258505 RepID=A0A7G8PLV9_9MYCO|nr:hypothetical protein [Mycolicibacterium fluoranthenivorans]QNJ95325.1 hypothetical protein HZU40_14500 [Mycolicibacterium fluoranthenivorans]